MVKEIIVPSPGESITQVQLAKWLAADGEAVEKDQEIVEIDSDKASFPVTSPVSGILRHKAAEGDTLSVGALLALVDEHSDATARSLPVTSSSTPKPTPLTTTEQHIITPEIKASPLAGKIMKEEKINPAEISAAFPGKKITRRDLERFAGMKKEGPPTEHAVHERREERKKLTTLRIKLAERLVSVKNQTAMLTTFNEVNLRKFLEIKERYGESFKMQFGTSIGLMSVFTKAVTIALKEFPQVNSMIDGDELITPDYCDIGIAVSAPKGLVVPVIRNAETLSLAELESKIKELAVKSRENKITIDDMKGGTFTITNGGVFGSMMSTPILNPPQSAILGMHKIMERPVAENHQVVIAPMMYVALSYDHRVIDGRESVGFLVRVKELVEDPVRMLTGGEDPYKLLLDL